jgi:o-succinylbenzoate synthase
MNIDLFHKTLHFKIPARTSRGAYSVHNMIIVSMTDSDGRIGLGECAPLPDLSCDRDAYTMMSDVARLINKALEHDDYADFLRPYPALLFALESAMYDMKKSSLLYDTPFARCEEGIPTNGLVWMASYDDMLAQVKKKIVAGFRCIKLKIGALEWEEEIGLIRFLRSKFSRDSLELRVDANGGFSFEEAPKRLDELAKYDVHSIEQPIPAQNWEQMTRLCRNTPLPIALDEELIGLNLLHEKQSMLDIVRPQYIVVKPTLHGGISGSIEWVSEARKRGIGSWMTSALESNIGLRNVALLAARCYGPHILFPQGLGTGQLFTDNISMDIELRGAKLWREETSD